MPKIIECVPNFSEGRDQKVITAIADAVRATPGATLLDVDPGQSTNRTVYTFVGDPQSIVEAALNAAKAAFPLIDMRKHKGEHPRMGALDVCPFIPISDVTVAECVEISKQFGARLAEEVGIPVFLYGASSDKEYRKTMPQIRAGEYEGLEERLKDDKWAPDFGSNTFVPSWGGTVTGVRKFLIAYNINMLSTKEQAHRIALNLREKGRSDDQPGRLLACQGIGWWLEEANIAQISLNLTDMDVTPMHVAYEEAKKDAQELKVAVTGSELVGLVPLSAMLEAAEFYIAKEGLMVLDDDQKVHLAINRLGLATLSPFNPKERIIEYCLPCSSSTLLIQKTVNDFVLSVGERSSAPGGGSVSAVLAALGCGLGAMVGKLTYGKKQWESLDKRMRCIIPPLHAAMLDILPMVDADTEAFNDYMVAMKLPKDTTEEKKVREDAMEAGLKIAVGVPLSLAKRSNSIWSTLLELAECGNINCKSDLQVAARCLETAVQGAKYNVDINLGNIKDVKFREENFAAAEKEADIAVENRDKVLNILAARK
eukprot:GFUD01023643.1.p1 GENE.GFUD01023643.1~~GFUD01023643.1.p1  ORF type:complete len:540 (-),score=166.13 GFUD01023643.1:93-1712(-)